MSLNFGKSFLSTVWWNDQEALTLQTYSLYGWIVSLIEMLILRNFNIEWILVWQFGQDSSNSSNFPNIQYTQSYISTRVHNKRRELPLILWTLDINHAYWCQLTYWLLYIDHNYVQGVVNRSVKNWMCFYIGCYLHYLLLSKIATSCYMCLTMIKSSSKIFEWDYLNDRFHKLIFKDTIDYVIELYAIKRFWRNNF